MDKIPAKEQLYNPLLDVLKSMGGSGTIDEITEGVIKLLKVPEALASTPHDEENSNQTELEYRLAWARTYLKNYGVLENSSRGVWALKSDAGPKIPVNAGEVNSQMEATRKSRNPKTDKVQGLEIQSENEGNIDIGEAESPDADWRKTLFRVLTQDVSPDAFERLTMRLLRESGFVHAEVTGRSGDGGIDGKGIARIAGVLSFHVVFQCKRFRDTVTSAHIRDFRGAMAGRGDKGLFITTGRFTRDAIAEAKRDGTSPIDLIDGDGLADMLKALKLGVKTELVEHVTVDEEWLQGL